jgi:acyl-CoA hydrolase
MVASRQRRNPKIGAKYHCGVTAVEPLTKARAVRRTAYIEENMSRTPLMSWKSPCNLSIALLNVARITKKGRTNPPIGRKVRYPGSEVGGSANWKGR